MTTYRNRQRHNKKRNASQQDTLKARRMFAPFGADGADTAPQQVKAVRRKWVDDMEPIEFGETNEKP